MTAPLENVRVVEIDSGFGAYAGRLLSVLGAHVVTLLESQEQLPLLLQEGTHPSLDYTAEFHATGRDHRIVGSLESESARGALADELSSANVLLTGLSLKELQRLGLDPESVLARYPSIVHLSVTPFGLTGPRANDPASDLTVLAAGGLLSLSKERGRVPTRPFGRQSVIAASLHAAFGVLVALRVAEQTRVGQLVDVSAQDAVAHSLENAAQFWDLEGIVRAGVVGEETEAGSGIYGCEDGHVYLMTAMHGGLLGWESFVDWIQTRDPAAAAAFRDHQWRDPKWRATPEARAIFRSHFEAVTSRIRAHDLVNEGQEFGVNIALMADALDLLAHRQLVDRDFFVPRELPYGKGSVIMPGPPFRMSRSRVRVDVMSSEDEGGS